jgi:negative regulator of flagellin synthesis FlgM
VNVERVAEIKRAIAEGRFQVNPERIADGLLQSVRDMLGTDR